MPEFECPAQNPQGQSKFLLPPGEYQFSLIGVVPGISNGAKTAGAEYMNLIFEHESGTRVWANVIFAPSCIWVGFAVLAAFGEHYNTGEKVNFSKELFEKYMGKTCTLKLKQVQGTNGLKNEVAAYIPAETPEDKLEAANADTVKEIKESDIPF